MAIKTTSVTRDDALGDTNKRIRMTLAGALWHAEISGNIAAGAENRETTFKKARLGFATKGSSHSQMLEDQKFVITEKSV